MVSEDSPVSPKLGVIDYVLAAMSVSFGVGSLIVFTVFIYRGPFPIAELGLSLSQALVFDAVLCAVFFLQHSGMIRRAVRRWMSQGISERYLGAVFSVVSGITLLALVFLWQETLPVLASLEGFSRGFLRAIFFLAITCQVWGIWALKSADLFGVDGVLRRVHSTLPSTSMVARGPYRWVRHPLYITTLLMIWSYPAPTADRLLLNVLFTGWVLVGTVLEERDLVAVYGDAYRTYQRRVPMLIPYRRPWTSL